MSGVLLPWTFPFFRTALAAGLLCGAALSLLGVFVVARREVFAGLTIAQLAGLGTVIGVVAGARGGTLAVALGVVAAGLWALGHLKPSARSPRDASLGAFYLMGAALSVLILSKSPRGESDTLTLLFGNVLAVGPAEVVKSAALLAAVAAALAWGLPRWIWLAFDPQSAEVAGVNVGVWNGLFYALFAAAVVLGIHVFGVVLAFGFLLFPAATALIRARRVGGLFRTALLIAALATTAGFWLSFRWDYPTGPFLAVLLGLAWLSVRAATP
jgi:zinc transport system permease protein